VKIHGCTVHFVTPNLDKGPIIVQAAVPVLSGDTEEMLGARVLEQEHKIYPQAIHWFAEDRLNVTPDGNVILQNQQPVDMASRETALRSPWEA
jgi:phosphoribosylglycinamide formyltransferase-1